MDGLTKVNNNASANHELHTILYFLCLNKMSNKPWQVVAKSMSEINFLPKMFIQLPEDNFIPQCQLHNRYIQILL